MTFVDDNDVEESGRVMLEEEFGVLAVFGKSNV